MPSKKFTIEFLKEIQKYMFDNNLGISATARHFDVDRGTLRDAFIKNNMKFISRKDGKLKVNSDYFKIIDTEHKAYWLGFLIADGYLCTSKNRLELCLAKIDKEHIELFKKDLESEHKIQLKECILNNKIFYAYRINITDKQISQDLQKYGFNNNKSYEAYIPFDYIPLHLMRHFIRGLFDGDGCVYTHKEKSGNIATNIIICTTISCKMINDITICLKKYLNIDVKYGINKDSNPVDINIYKQEDMWKFYNWLYKDATIYLQRKYDKFAVLRQKHEKSQDN